MKGRSSYTNFCNSDSLVLNYISPILGIGTVLSISSDSFNRLHQLRRIEAENPCKPDKLDHIHTALTARSPDGR